MEIADNEKNLITKDDLLNLKIILETSKTVDEFLFLIGVKPLTKGKKHES